MEQRFMRFLRGYVRIRITGTSYDRFLNLCAYHNMELWDLCPAGEAYEANLSRADFKRLRPITRKSHARIRITERHGLPFFVYRHRRRKMYVAGIAAAVLVLFWLSSHVWLITVDGNVSQTDDVLFEYLDGIGITHGMPKREVDCRALAADIRDYFPNFTWVAARLEGTRLSISVREGLAVQEPSDTPEGAQRKDQATELVATKEGTVVSVYVRSGLAQVEPGDPVAPGDVLVSGKLPIYDDSGSVRTYQYVPSDADLVIRTAMEYDDKVPFTVRQKRYTGERRAGFLIRVGEIPFGIGTVRHSFQHSDSLREVFQAKLFENFYLPLYAERLTVKEYRYEEKKRTREQVQAAAEENFRHFLKNLEEKGVQLFKNNVRIEWYEEFCTVSGTLEVGEEAVRTEIIEERSQEELQTDEYG